LFVVSSGTNAPGDTGVAGGAADDDDASPLLSLMPLLLEGDSTEVSTGTNVNSAANVADGDIGDSTGGAAADDAAAGDSTGTFTNGTGGGDGGGAGDSSTRVFFVAISESSPAAFRLVATYSTVRANNAAICSSVIGVAAAAAVAFFFREGALAVAPVAADADSASGAAAAAADLAACLAARFSCPLRCRSIASDLSANGVFFVRRFALNRGSRSSRKRFARRLETFLQHQNFQFRLSKCFKRTLDLVVLFPKLSFEIRILFFQLSNASVCV